MCLFNISEEKFAEKDIVVYKVLRKKRTKSKLLRFFNPYQYFTLVMDVKIKLGRKYTSKIKIIAANNFNLNCSNFPIIENALHSFMYEKDALDVPKLYMNQNNFVIVKCIIPKGSRYYIGDSFEYDAYASNKLIITKTYDIKIIKKDIELYL